MTSKVYSKAKDYSNEPTRFGVFFPDITAANYDAQVANIDLLIAAANGVTSGDFNGKQLNAVDVPVPSKAAAESAQRELKWRVTYSDTVDAIGNGSFEIPMADTAELAANGQDLDQSGGSAGEALVSAIQTYCVSRLGNAILVESVKLVGRNI